MMTNVTSCLGFNLVKEESDQIVDLDHRTGCSQTSCPPPCPPPPPIGPGRLRQQLKGVGVNPGPAEFWILLIRHTC